MRRSDIKAFQEAIRATHGCEAVRVKSVPVREIFQGKTAWEGFVEVFDIKGHARAKHCYAWRYLDGKEWRYTTVLEIPPVDSPQTAVKIAIAAKSRVN